LLPVGYDKHTADSHLTPLSEDVLMMVYTKGKAALENIALNKGHKVSNTRVKDNYCSEFSNRSIS
jgi:hypothetical protein